MHRSEDRKRIPLAFLLATLLVAVGCAKKPPLPPPVPPISIQLEPRCLQNDAIPEFSAPFAQHFPRSAAEFSHPSRRQQSQGPRAYVQTVPRATFGRVSVGFITTPSQFPMDPDSEGATDLRFLAALLASGDATPNPEQTRNAALTLATEISARVEGDWLWLEARYPVQHESEAIRLLLERMDTTPVASTSLDSVRRQTALGRLAEQLAPRTLASRAFLKHHRARSSVGAPTDWDAFSLDVTPAEIQTRFEELLRPDEAVFVISAPPIRTRPAGSDDEHARAWLEAILASVTSSQEAIPAPALRSDSAPTSATNETKKKPPGPEANDVFDILIVNRASAPQVELLSGYPTAGPGDPDFLFLEGLASLLGGDVGGRLFRDLRERQGLAYIINAEQDSGGYFAVRTQARHERVVALLTGIDAHFSALATQGLEPCEVVTLASRLRGENAIRLDAARAVHDHSMRSMRLTGTPPDFSATPFAASTAADLEDLEAALEEVAHRVFSSPPTVVLVGQADWLIRDLKAAFPSRRIRVLDEELSPIDP